MKNKFFRKAVAVLLSIVMLVPMIPAAFAAQPSDFTDFPTGWSNEAMTAAVANGLLNGRTATTIEPQGNLTRAEMATIINRAFGAVKTADISQFHDVSASDWFYTEIAKAVNMQTFQGDGTGTMRPNSLITREEVFAVVARSLVLETSDFSALNSHPDGYNVADWAKPYASILSQKKYINGDSYGNLNPKSYITREEFAQIMHNIIKTYYTVPAMFNHSGASSSLIRTSGVTLSDVTINGDLIIGDGVGAGTVVLKNVIIKGRLLARGGEGSVTLTNTTVEEGVVVKDVNGIVHFNNYRTEAPFVGIREITKATFKKRTGSGSGVTTHSVTINGAGYDNKTYSVQSGKNFTFPGPNGVGHDAFAGWVLSTDTENKKVYKQGATYKSEGNVTFVPVYYYNVEHYFQLEAGSDAYKLDKKSEKAGYARIGESVTCDKYLDTKEYDEIKYSPNKQYKKEDRQGEVLKNTIKTFKLYYDFNPTYEYKIEYYISSLSTPNSFEKHDELTKIKRDFAGAQVFVSKDDKTVKGYIFKDTHADNVTEGVVTSDGNLVLKLYYDRCDVTIEYVLGQGKFKDESKHVKKAKFGATITLPAIDDMEHSYDLESWYSNPSIGGVNEFAPEYALVITDYDDAAGEPKITLTAVWGNTKFYNVQFFNNRYQLVKTVRVPENATVDKNVFSSLAGNLLSFAGYEENSDISLLYAQDPYVHTVNSAWYYKPDLNATPIKWERFDSNIKITGDIADADDIVKVNIKIPRITITAKLVKMSNLPYSFKKAYEEQGLAIDEKSNPKKTGTRAADTIKDFLWDGFYKDSKLYDTEGYSLIRQQIEKAGDKAFGKLREKGILGSNNEILDQSFKVKFASFIDRDLNKANIRKFIIDKAKDSLEGNDTLHEAIIDYFESIANSGDAEAIADLESLIEGTVKEALSDGSANTTKLVEEMCEKMLDDPGVVKAAIKEIYGIEVELDSAAMNGNAKTTIIDLAKSLLKTDDDLIDRALREVPYNAKSDGAQTTYLYTAEKIKGVKTLDFFKKLMSESDVTMDSLKGYGIDEAKLADYIKPHVIDMVIDRLGDSNDADFFNKVMAIAFEGTPFESYKRDKIAAMSTKELVKTAVSEYLKTKSIEEIATSLGYKDADGNADLNALYNAQKDEIKKYISDKTSDEAFFTAHIASLVNVNSKTYAYDDFNKDLKEVIKMFITDKLTATSGADLAEDDVVKDMLGDKAVINSVMGKLYDRLGNDSDFFDKMVEKQNFGIYIKADSLNGKDVATFINELATKELSEVTTADALAKLAGYNAWDDFAEANSAAIITAVSDEIEEGKDVYKDIIKKLTGDNNYDFTTKNEPIDVFTAVVAKLVGDARSTDEAVKDDALEKLGKLTDETVDESKLSAIEAMLTAGTDDEKKDFFKPYLQKAVGDENNTIIFDSYTTADKMISAMVAKELADADSIATAIADMGIDADSLVEQAKSTAADIINSKIGGMNSDDAFVRNYLKDYAGIDYDGAIVASDDARKFIIDIVKAKIGTPSVINDALAKEFGYANLGDLFEDSTVRSILITEAQNRADADTAFVREQIKAQLGITYTGALPTTGLELIADYAENKIDTIDNVDNLASELGYADSKALFNEVKSILADKVKDDIEGANGDAELLRYVKQYIPEYVDDIVPDNSIVFIQKIVKIELDNMTWSEIKENLADAGYSEDELNDMMDDELANMLKEPKDDFIVDVINVLASSDKYKNITLDALGGDMAIDFVSEEAAAKLASNNKFFEDVMKEIFDFVPDDIHDPDLKFKGFMSEIIIDIFENENHHDQRDKMIHFATVEIVEHNHIDMLDDYVDYAIEHLDSLPGEKGGTTRLDETIDEIIADKYEDTINKLVDELVEGEQFTIEPDVKFVLEAIYGMIDDYSYDAIKAQIEQLIADKGAPEGLLEKVFKIYPEATLRAIYDKPYNDVVAQIEQGLIDNSNGNAALVNTGMTFVINPISDIYAPLYDTNFNRFTDKANSLFYYEQNEYLQELVTMTSPETFFDGSEAAGYKLKSYSDYYDLMLKLAIIGDDAINWYTENLNEQQFDELVLNYEDFFVEKANLLADILEEYADTGDIPDKLDNNIVSTIEKTLREKFASQLDGVLEWYKTSPLNKEYGSGDYEYIRKAVNKAFNGIDITTDEVFDLLMKLCDTAAGKYDDLGGIHDKIVKVDDNTYEVTVKGKTLTLKRINDNEFEVGFEGKAVKLLRKFDDGYNNYCESYQIYFEGNYIELKRAIEG